MTQLPGSGYLSNDLRTEGEMKTALEQLHDVVAEIGSEAPTLLTISVGALDPPLSSMILVRSEGFSEDAADILNTIATTDITQGRVVILKNNDGTSTESGGQTITIAHGTSAGSITMTDGSSFVLCAERILVIIYSGDHWIEVWRSYGRANSEDAEAERLSLGLGTASVEEIADNAVGSGGKVLKVGSSDLAATELIAMDASGNLIAGGPVSGGNADTLDTLDSLSFVRTDSGSAQSIDANLTATSTITRITANATGLTAGFMLQDDGVERGILYLDTSDGDVYLSTKSAGDAEQGTLRINALSSELQYRSSPASDWGTVSPFSSLVDGAGEFFEETGISTAYGTFGAIAHGFQDDDGNPVIPRLVIPVLVCTVSDESNGYSLGDEVSYDGWGSSVTNTGMAFYADDTNLNYIIAGAGGTSPSAGGAFILDKLSFPQSRSGAHPDEWDMTIRAWK